MTRPATATVVGQPFGELRSGGDRRAVGLKPALVPVDFELNSQLSWSGSYTAVGSEKRRELWIIPGAFRGLELTLLVASHIVKCETMTRWELAPEKTFNRG